MPTPTLVTPTPVVCETKVSCDTKKSVNEGENRRRSGQRMCVCVWGSLLSYRISQQHKQQQQQWLWGWVDEDEDPVLWLKSWFWVLMLVCQSFRIFVWISVTPQVFDEAGLLCPLRGRGQFCLCWTSCNQWPRSSQLCLKLMKFLFHHQNFLHLWKKQNPIISCHLSENKQSR